MTTDYIEQSDIEDVFGASNVSKWADLDNDGDETAITARIDKAIAWAENEINSRLREGPYVLPLANDESDVPLEIVDVAANLAGVWLYENRGVQDFDPESGQSVHRLEWNRARAEKTLKEILAGVRVLDAVKHNTQNGSIPKVIKNS
jgi:hypothetical protein